MQIVATIARYLLALTFAVIGLNGFVHFLPMAPMPPLASQFTAVLVGSHYMLPILLLQIVCGILFLANRYVPLALTLIGPVIVNILLFHVLMNPGGIVPGALAALCWFAVFYRLRSAFAGILRDKIAP